MKKELFFTAGQFAGLHHLNKRTLHYYDQIGLFSPARVGENGYRYYTYRQSAELLNILALRELGMSIEEIKLYLLRPSMDDFLKIAGQKTGEIDVQIRRLKSLKALLQEKQDAVRLCSKLEDGEIAVTRFPKEYMLLTPMRLKDTGNGNMGQVMKHLQLAWENCPYKTGCGSYILLDRARQGEFDTYDGLFTTINHPHRKGNHSVRPAGDYLCGYCIGDWGKIPGLYREMFAYAEAEHLELTGNCYESGLNEFAISGMEEYVTRIEIRCQRPTAQTVLTLRV